MIFLILSVNFIQVQHTHRKVYKSQVHSSIHFLKGNVPMQLASRWIKHYSEHQDLLLPLLISIPHKGHHIWPLTPDMPVLEFYINGIIQHISFCAWLLLCNMVFLFLILWNIIGNRIWFFKCPHTVRPESCCYTIMPSYGYRAICSLETAFTF